MAVRQPRYSKEEFAQRGDALYESQIRLPPVGSANDIETGDFEIADSSLATRAGAKKL
jgi:hypothetical protein